MMNYSTSQQINAMPEVVFDRMTDFANLPSRMRGIKRVEMLTNGQTGVGTKFKETRVMFGREAAETMEVTEFVVPRKYVLVCDSCGCRYRSEFRFDPIRTGTEMTLSFQSEPLSFFAKAVGFLMRPLMRKMMQKCMEETAKDLADLKRDVEASTNENTPGG